MENLFLFIIGNVCLMYDVVVFLMFQSQKIEFWIVYIVEVVGDFKFSLELVYMVMEKLLIEIYIKILDYDVIEWNELFVVIDVLFNYYYFEEREKFNIFGGVLVYGYFYVCLGIINIFYFMQVLKYKNKFMGLIVIVGVGGVGMVILIEYLGVKNV